jgi:Dihaem cytochrome c
MPAKVNTLWQKECSSCHIAYPPGLLSAASWRKLMSTLDKHFGADASLTATENDEITAFLVANPSNRWSATTSPLRITESQWFKTKHGKEIAPEVWKREAIKSSANCQACHAGAAAGDFNERQIKIPK